VTASALLVWSNLIVPALPGGAGVRTAGNLGGLAVLVLVARAGGLTWRELGITRSSWQSGARWGATALTVVTAGYAVALAVPALRALLGEPGGLGWSTGEVLGRALVLIPLGTVLCEEIAFRGVLLASASRLLPARPALVVTSVVFGLWHLRSAQPLAGSGVSPIPQGTSVAGIVLLTAAGGVVFGWLRLRSGSLLAPIGLHLGTNSVGLVAAAIAVAAR
jgi:membrane protease YdiL (CAAX protease family)